MIGGKLSSPENKTAAYGYRESRLQSIKDT